MCSDVSEQVITMEEDGRLGNLLMETATLLLVGKKLNKRVQVLPQVNTKLTNYFPTLPTEAIDHTKVKLMMINKHNVNIYLLTEIRDVYFHYPSVFSVALSHLMRYRIYD